MSNAGSHTRMQQFRRANYRTAFLHVIKLGQQHHTVTSRVLHVDITPRPPIGCRGIVLFTHATLGSVLSTTADLTLNISPLGLLRSQGTQFKFVTFVCYTWIHFLVLHKNNHVDNSWITRVFVSLSEASLGRELSAWSTNRERWIWSCVECRL